MDNRWCNLRCILSSRGGPFRSMAILELQTNIQNKRIKLSLFNRRQGAFVETDVHGGEGGGGERVHARVFVCCC